MSTRWKCPTTGSIIDFEPTIENYKKLALNDRDYTIVMIGIEQGKYKEGISPWDPEQEMIEYEQ